MKRYTNYLSIHLFLIVIVISFFFSCGDMAKKKPIEVNIIKTKDEIRQDSIKKQEELIVFGNIRFGMNEDEFEKSKKEFIEKCYDKETFPHTKIGDYEFSGSWWRDFYQKKLYYVRIKGLPISYDRYDNKMKTQYDALYIVLKNKYGYPIGDRGIPESYAISKGDSYVCASWLKGDKRISISIYQSQNKYTLDLEVYQESILKLINDESEVKKRDAIKKGVEVL